MVNSKTLQYGFLDPELKLYEELTCVGRAFYDKTLHMNAYNLNYLLSTISSPAGTFRTIVLDNKEEEGWVRGFPTVTEST